jgi:hypothetical protein
MIRVAQEPLPRGVLVQLPFDGVGHRMSDIEHHDGAAIGRLAE